MPNSFLDKKFVTTAIIIAFIYTCLVIVVNILVGKEAAGIAGVALTALSIAIFKQFENLRFKNTPDETTTISVNFRWWQVILIGFLFSRVSSLLVDLMDAVVPLMFHVTEPYNKDLGNINGKLINHYSIWEQSTKCLAFMICGFIATKAFTRISYSVIIVAGLFGIIIDFYTEYLYFILFGTVKFDIKADLDDYKYSILWIAFSFIGSYWGQSKRKSP